MELPAGAVWYLLVASVFAGSVGLALMLFWLSRKKSVETEPLPDALVDPGEVKDPEKAIGKEPGRERATACDLELVDAIQEVARRLSRRGAWPEIDRGMARTLTHLPARHWSPALIGRGVDLVLGYGANLPSDEQPAVQAVVQAVLALPESAPEELEAGDPIPPVLGIEDGNLTVVSVGFGFTPDEEQVRNQLFDEAGFVVSPEVGAFRIEREREGNLTAAQAHALARLLPVCIAEQEVHDRVLAVIHLAELRENVESELPTPRMNAAKAAGRKH